MNIQNKLKEESFRVIGFTANKLILYTLFACLIGSGVAQASSCEDEAVEAERIYMAAIESNPTVKQIHLDGLTRRQAESGQLKILLESIKLNKGFDSGTIHNLVIAGLESDCKLFEVFDTEVKAYKDDNGWGARSQLTACKMSIITKYALKLANKLVKNSLFYSLIEGNLPKGYDIEAPVFNYFPNETHIFSNGKRGNALKSLLLKIWLIQNKKTSQSDVASLFGGLDRCVFMHITPLPDEFAASKLFQASPYFFSDATTSKALITIHNGYALGGQRWETRYLPGGKVFGPEDCSSFVAKYVGANRTFSTEDQVCAFQLQHGFQFEAFAKDPAGLKETWKKSAEIFQQEDDVKLVGTLLEPLDPQASPNTLTAGMVHAERKYRKTPEKPREIMCGSVGHTGIVIGTIGSGNETQVLTITAGRDLEESGREFNFGVEKRPLLSGPLECKVYAGNLVMFFELKKNHGV